MSCFYRTDARFGGHFFHLTIMLIGVYCSSARAQWRPYIEMDAFARSEPIAIVDAIHEWKGEFGRGETQYLQSWLEIGVRSENWKFGLLHRSDYAFWFSPDTAELYGSVQNDRPLDVGREYDVRLESNALIASGIRFAWLPEWRDDLRLEIGLSMLNAHYLIDGKLQGSAVATAEKAYNYSAWVDYSYTEDELFERDVEEANGYGASLDVDLDWQATPKWRINLRGRDLLGAIWWRDLPFTRARAYSDRTSTNSNGYTEWAPLVSGVEGYHSSYTQSLSPRITGDLYYRHRTLNIGMGGRYQFDDTLARVGVGFRAGEWDLFAWWWTEDNGIELSAVWHKLRLCLGSDELRFDKSRLLTLTLSYGY